VDFPALCDEILDAYFSFYPRRASDLGLHAYDGQVGRYDRSTLDARVRTLRTFRRELEATTTPPLPAQEAVDREVLLSSIERELFELEDLRTFERNPMVYNALIDAGGYVQRAYAPLGVRVARLIEHLEQVPGLLADARRTLTGPVPRPHAEIAAEMFEGTIRWLEDDLVRAVAGISPDLMDRFTEGLRKAVEAVRSFLGFLREEVLPRATPEFALGEDRFCAMLWAGERLDLGIPDLLRLGDEELERLQAAFEETARAIDPHRPPEEVARALAAEHPSEADLIPYTRQILHRLREFLTERDIVTLPPTDDVRVEPTPPFLRWAFAMMDTAGPFEEETAESYYYITLPDPDWTPEQKEQWLRRFDVYTLENTSVHEVYPGHYVHFRRIRHAPSRVTKVFQAYSFTEGWAHYAEEMMLEQGYGEGKPKLRLAQLLDALVRAVRYAVSIRMHTQGMGIGEATRWFMAYAYLDPLPASREAVRGAFDPGYLNYTLGKLLIQRLRDELSHRMEHDFRLREFHDRLLGLGGPPIPVARQVLLHGLADVRDANAVP
jgi:hypothetical protein